MLNIRSYFESWPQGTEALSKEQLVFLSFLHETNTHQEMSQDISNEIVENGSRDDKKRMRKLRRERLFKSILHYHDLMSGPIRMSTQYALWIVFLSKRTTDIAAYHGLSIYTAKKEGVDMISLDFWATKICSHGLWKSRTWKELWNRQKISSDNLLDSKEAWNQFHNSFAQEGKKI